MKIAFDPAKNERNIVERGLSFERAADFEFESALYFIDTRRDYGETRVIAMGYIDGRLHILCFIETGTGIRVISLRKANAREVRKYAKAKVDE